jgi:ABC-type sugar transport system substrate-binding protein
MKTSLKILSVVATLAIAASVLAVPAAAQEESAAAEPAAEAQFTGCLAAPASTTPYSARINQKIAEYGAEKGIEFTVFSAEQSTETQVNQLRDCIALQPDIIVLIANDVEALCPVLQEAKDAGIPVLTSNAGVNCTDLVEGFTGPNYTLQAEILAEYTCDNFATDGDVLNVGIVQGDLGYSAEIERTGGFENKIAELCPDKVAVIDKQSGQWSQQRSLEVARDMVTKHGEDLDMIYAEDDTMGAGVADGLEQSGLQPGEVILVGIGGNVDGFRLMDEGWMQATIYQSPFIDGELAVDTALRILAGEDIEDRIAIDSPVITPDNMSEYEPAY